MTMTNNIVSEVANQENELLALKSTQLILGRNIRTYVYSSQTYSEFFPAGDEQIRVKTFMFQASSSGYHFFQAACIKFETYHSWDGHTEEDTCSRLVVRPQDGSGKIYIDMDVIWGHQINGESCTISFAITVQTDDQGTLTLI